MIDLKKFNFLFSEYDTPFLVASVATVGIDSEVVGHSFGDFIPLISVSADGQRWYPYLDSSAITYSPTVEVTTTSVTVTNSNANNGFVKVIGIKI